MHIADRAKDVDPLTSARMARWTTIQQEIAWRPAEKSA
jgi:hypothetical protein